MTDQKLIAGIFNDFLGLYTGKNTDRYPSFD